MADFVFSGMTVEAVSCCVPSFEQSIDVQAEGADARYVKMFVKRTGVHSRHISLCEQTCVDLGVEALKKALEKAGWQADDLDSVIFVSQTPDYAGGTCNALLMHHYFDLKQECACFDLPLGCSALPYAMNIACSFLMQPAISKIAILCGDAQWPNYASIEEIKKERTFLMGEAVGCMLLGKNPLRADAKWRLSLYSQGHGFKHLCHFDTGIKNAWRKAPSYILPNGETYISGNYMDGLEITSFAVGTVSGYIREFWQRSGTAVGDYAAIILHQANAQIIGGMKKALSLADDKVPMSIDRYANTSAASSLVTICDHFGSDSAADPLRICNAAFGIGLSWGISEFYLTPDKVLPIFSSDLVLQDHFLKPNRGEGTDC